MSNRTFICLECRTVKRAKAGLAFSSDYRCRVWSKSLNELDWRRRVPQKDDDKGWKELQVYLAHMEHEWGRQRTKIGVSKLKKIDRMISMEESRPRTPVGEKKIKLLRFQRRTTAKEHDLI